MERCPVFVLNSTSKSPDGASLTKPDDGSIYGSYLYWNGVKWANEASAVHLGANAGGPYQGANGIAIGPSAGISQGISAIAIGLSAGNSYQGPNAIAIGYQTGFNSQGSNAIAIGSNAGQNMQSNSAIAIGVFAGQISQSVNAIAIGSQAGNNVQSANSIAIGANAGLDYQGINCIAIGSSAGKYNQGHNAIAIGTNAGATSQAPNSIILNASSIALNTTTAGLFVSSIQGPRGSSNVLSYDTETCEVYYNGSSQRYKYDIQNLSTDTSAVYNLQPKSFKYKLTDEPDVGLIAEEAYKCDPSFAYLDKDQIPEGIQWNVITTYLIAEFKKLKMELNELESVFRPK